MLIAGPSHREPWPSTAVWHCCCSKHLSSLLRSIDCDHPKDLTLLGVANSNDEKKKEEKAEEEGEGEEWNGVE